MGCHGVTGGNDVLYWQGVQWCKLRIPPMWYNRGFTLSGGCMQNSLCRFGKISSGFCNQTFLQYGCKRAFTSFRGCMLGPSCRFGKISLGFCNQTFLQYGCKRAFTSFRGCMLGSSCRFGKISLGFGNHASLAIWGKMGINSRTSSAELSKPWWSS